MTKRPVRKVKVDRENWKARALKAEAYAYDYGNTNGRCEAGYWQHPGYICHHCRHDMSSGKPCPEAARTQRRQP